MKSRFLQLGIVFLCLAVPLACVGWSFPLEFLVMVLFGWAFFLWQVVPEITVSWSGLAMGVLALGGFAFGLHQLLKRVAVSSSPDSDAVEWRGRWSAAIVVGIVVLFVAGISVVGVAHQSVWLATSGERWTESSWEARRRMNSRNNLKQIGLAAHNYHDMFASFPPGGVFNEDGLPLHSWETHLLGYFEAGPLPVIDMTRPWTDPVHADVFMRRMPLFENPMIGWRSGDEDPFTDPAGYGLSHYAANERLFWPNSATRIVDITDGSSETIMAGEVNANFRPWGDPVNWRDPALGINQSPDGFGSPFREGAHVLFCDGRTRFLSEDIDTEVVRALGTPAGGDEVGEF